MPGLKIPEDVQGHPPSILAQNSWTVHGAHRVDTTYKFHFHFHPIIEFFKNFDIEISLNDYIY